jgi:5'-nucleotidase
MLILISNDDGILSDGITALRDVLGQKHEVFVVAPERERTCVAHAITLHKPLRIKEISEGSYSTSGTPADCIFLGVKTLLPRRPDFIVSGINKGPNMGQDVNYSGTVAAAKEGAFLGIPSISVSIAGQADFHFADAARVTEEAVNILAARPLPDSTFLNINIPNAPYEQLKGFMVTRLGKRIYNDKIVERTDPRGGKYYWIGGDGNRYEPKEGTDFLAVEDGFISVTPLGLDGTSESSLEIYTTYFRRGL